MKFLSLHLAIFLGLIFGNNNMTPKNIYNIKFNNVVGKEMSLDEFKGKKILVVNVASYCGYTRQYKDLQILQDKYNDKLQVIAFPCNDFGSQEPGSESQIAQFCETNYNIRFPIMSKVNIRSNPIHPIYEWLTNSDFNGWNHSKPRWNFYKYLIDENGSLIKSFCSGTNPLSSEITESL